MEASVNLSHLPTPKSISIAITGRCNLKCKYCFYANEMTALSDLPTKKWLVFFKDLEKLGVMDVSLTGGEAFTRPDLFEIIDGIITSRMRYSILTNGTLISEKILSGFEVGKRKMRLDFIQISVDGSKEEIHNLSRPNSFKRTLRGLYMLKEAGFPVVVRVTINRYNLNDLENIAHLLLDEIGLSSMATNEAMPIGSGCINKPEISLSPVDQAKAMEVIKRLLTIYPGRLVSMAGPQAKLKKYSEMVHAQKTGKKAFSWRMGYLSACGCVFHRIDILHDGTIVPCAMLPGLPLGNITRNSLRDIWQSHPIMNALRQRRNIPMSSVPGCEKCEWASFCNGSCPGLAHQLTGDYNRANPQDCYRLFLRETGEEYALFE